MDAYKLQKKVNFSADIEILHSLAKNGVNILEIHPIVGGYSDDIGTSGVIIVFEYLYHIRNGNVNWRKGSVQWCYVNSSFRDALQYVLDVATELQRRLEQEDRC